MDGNLIRSFFSVRPGVRSTGDIIAWWELRRLPYNLFVAIAGMVAIFLFYFFADKSGKIPPGQDEVEPIGLIIGVVLAAVGANICYTAGWLVELFVRGMKSRRLENAGPVLLISGMFFSAFVVGLPAIIWGVIDFIGLFQK